MLKTQEEIYKIIINYQGSFGDDYIEFLYSGDLLNELNELNLSPEQLKHSGNKFIRIQKSILSFSIFENEDDFLKISVVERVKSYNGDILIISKKNGNSISYINNISYINFNKENSFHFFTNAFYYVVFINFLKSLDNEKEDAFHFIDYFNKDNKKIVLTSLSEKSRIIIKYKNVIPSFSANVDYSKYVIDFLKLFEENNNQITKFLKNSFIEFASRYDFDNRLPNIFTNLTKIIETALLNFEIYINNLSIDKLKEEYNKYKSKYFNDISDILSKLTQKIIGLPIVFATTLFVINKITNDNTDNNSLFLYILIAIIFISSIFINSLLKIHYKDLLSLHLSFTRDYNTLKNNNFFRKYPDEIEDFKDIKDNVDSKISILKYVTIGYYWLLNLSNLLLIYFILKKVSLNIFDWNTWAIFCGLVSVLILLVIGHLIITYKKDRKSVA